MARSLNELRQHLVGEWLFNNSFEDSSGNGNHGVPTNVEWVPTSRGMKPYFTDGSLVTVSNNTTFTQQEFTIASWVRVDSIITGDEPMFYLGQTSSPYNQIRIATYSSSRPFQIRVSMGGETIQINPLYELSNRYNHVVGTFKNGTVKLYIDGHLLNSGTNTNIPQLDFNNLDIVLGEYTAADRHLHGALDVTSYYSTAFTDSEALALYNSTKTAYGVQKAEQSFAHKLQPSVDSSTVFATDMSTMNADGTLIDLSGNSNHGTVNGCCRAGGYFRDGMSFDGVNDAVTIPTSSELSGMSKIHTVTLAKVNNSTHYGRFIDGYSFAVYIVELLSTIGIIIRTDDGIFDLYQNQFNQPYEYGKTMLVEMVWDAETELADVYVNGIKGTSVSVTGTKILESLVDVLIGNRVDGIRPLDGDIYLSSVSSEIGDSIFNSLAVLPLYELDCSKLPVQDGLTDHIPYTSAVINSGEFDIVASEHGNQLVCVSSGELVFQNAHAFDGDEYLTLTVDGEEYSGTGKTHYISIYSDTSGGLTDYSVQLPGTNEITLNTTTFLTGGQAINIIKNTTTLAEVYLRYNTYANVTDAIITIDYYIKSQDVIDKLHGIPMQIFLSDGTYWNFSDMPVVGWNKLILDTGTRTPTGFYGSFFTTFLRVDFNTLNITDQFAEGDIIVDCIKIENAASIEQDSTAITVNMAVGDVLDSLDIQFREPV